MIKDELKKLKTCCNNCKNYNGNFCRIITCAQPKTKMDPDSFKCTYFKRNTHPIIPIINIVAGSVNTLANKITDKLNDTKSDKDYDVKPEDIKEDK